MGEQITAAQLKSLQTLYGKWARSSLVVAAGDPREARLEWASQQIGRPVASFKELDGGEAAKLIDLLKQAVGQEVKPRWERPRRELAKAIGTHGRRGRRTKLQVMATPEGLGEVDRLRGNLGWTREQLDAWLRSRYSPLAGRAEPRILTMADCNRVRWGLKAMFKRSHPATNAEAEGGVANVS